MALPAAQRPQWRFRAGPEPWAVGVDGVVNSFTAMTLVGTERKVKFRADLFSGRRTPSSAGVATTLPGGSQRPAPAPPSPDSRAAQAKTPVAMVDVANSDRREKTARRVSRMAAVASAMLGAARMGAGLKEAVHFEP